MADLRRDRQINQPEQLLHLECVLAIHSSRLRGSDGWRFVADCACPKNAKEDLEKIDIEDEDGPSEMAKIIAVTASSGLPDSPGDADGDVWPVIGGAAPLFPSPIPRVPCVPLSSVIGISTCRDQEEGDQDQEEHPPGPPG